MYRLVHMIPTENSSKRYTIASASTKDCNIKYVGNTRHSHMYLFQAATPAMWTAYISISPYLYLEINICIYPCIYIAIHLLAA